MHEGLVGFNAWLTGHLAELRRNPGDDLMSQLIQASQAADEANRLSDREMQATAGLVLAAGFETTVNLLGNGIRMLLDTPDHLETLAARPELWPNAVEEILRLDSPVQMSARFAREDVTVGGTEIKRGELVIVYLAGANRDPKVFTDPHRFDIARDNAGSTCRSPAAGTSAWVRRWPVPRARSGCGRSSSATRTPGWPEQGSRRDTRVLRGWSTLPITLGKTRAALGS